MPSKHQIKAWDNYFVVAKIVVQDNETAQCCHTGLANKNKPHMQQYIAPEMNSGSCNIASLYRLIVFCFS